MNDQGLHIDLAIHLHQRTLLSVNQTIAPGQVVSLMGPSGSGKSTLVAAIAGFLPSVFRCRGTISLDGTDLTNLPAERRGMGVLFQDPLLFPHLSVCENLLFALPPGGNRLQRHERAMTLLDSVGLADLGMRDPFTLSGGQQARVALMRVLASNPRALLLDEPFSKLDAQLRDAVRSFVFEQVQKHALPTLLVTHDQADANALGGQILML